MRGPAYCIAFLAVFLSLPSNHLNAADLVKLHDRGADGDSRVWHVPRVSPDGEWVVFWSYDIKHQDYYTTPITLYSVRADGSGSPVALDASTQSFYPDAFYYFDACITEDSQYVVYNGNPDGNMYIVPISGGQSRVIGDASGDDPGFRNVQIAPDGRYVIMASSGDVSATLLPDGPRTVLHSLTEYDYQISPDGSRIVCRAPGWPSRNDGDVALFSVPIGGGEAVRLSGDMPPGQGVRSVTGGAGDPAFKISPDSQRVVYLADQDTNDVFELYSVPITGGSPVKLNPPISIGDVTIYGEGISPDSQHVVFTGDFETKWNYNIYSVPTLGGGAIKLNEPLEEGVVSKSYSARVTRDSKYVAYLSEGPPGEAFASPINGGAMVRLHPDLPEYAYIHRIYTFLALNYIYIFGSSGSLNFSSLPTGEFSNFCSKYVYFSSWNEHPYMSPNGRRFIWRDYYNVWEMELATREETLLFDGTVIPNPIETDFFISEQENRIVFLNHDYIYARALEDIPSATGSTWTQFK